MVIRFIVVSTAACSPMMTDIITKMLLFSFLIMSAAALQCMDENNNPVDWFAVYKLPATKHENKLISEGTAYTFVSSENTDIKLSNLSIKNRKSIIGNTLKKLYKNGNYLLYNDQPPNNTVKSSRGHTKGVVLFDKQNGLWLVHSVPQFPDLSQKSYTYPNSGIFYGQNLLCISLNLEYLNKMGISLQYNEIAVYEKKISPNLRKILPELVKASNNTRIKKVFSHITNIVSTGGVEFISFAKSRQYQRDLYEDLVAQYLKTDLLVETWPNVQGKLESNCNATFNVINIKEISFKFVNISFNSTHDHSKWAVSAATKGKLWLCIGDINRSKSQRNRGGGTVCFNNQKAAKDYQNIVKDVELCHTD